MEQNRTAQQNKLGAMPMSKLLFSMSGPLMLSMLALSMYNIVDGIYVSRLSEDALTATSLAFPVSMLTIAFSVGTAVGMNSLVSRRLGQGRTDDASRAATTGYVLALLSAVPFILFGVLFTRGYFMLYTDDPGLVEMGTSYLTIVCAFSPCVMIESTAERQLQSSGKVVWSMTAQLAGTVTNIVLDPIMIFGYLGCPAFGIAGAAWATVIGQAVACVSAVLLNYRKNKEVPLKFKSFRFDKKTVSDIYRVGLPSIVMQSISTVMSLGMNAILISFSSTAVAVFGVYFKLQSFVFMPVFGMMQGLVSIIAYNYGARSKERIDKAMKLALIYCVSIMAVGLALFQLIPDKLLSIFDAGEEMTAIGCSALREISLSFVLAAVSIVLGTVNQGLGVGLPSLLNSLFRQLVVLLPTAFLLSRTGDVHLVWYSFAIAEFLALFLTVYLTRRVYKQRVLPLANETVATA